MFNFIVVGAGMAGVSVADALADSSSVALIEAEDQPGYHSTGRSAALFVPHYGSALFTGLARASEAFLRSPPPGFSAQPLLRPRGALYLARSEQLDRLQATAGELRSGGSEVELLSLEAARARVPLLRPEYVAAALYEANVQDIDVEALLRGFLDRGRSHGVRLFTGVRLTRFEWHQGAWRLELGGAAVAAPVLVNAAGAWADEVSAACGAAALGLRPLRRTAALIDAPDGVSVSAWPAIMDLDEQFYLKPDAGRLLVSPADEEPMAPCDAYAEDLTVALGVDRMQAALDIAVRRVTHSWAGLRTFAPDRNPVVGFDRQVRGLFWCAGQGGYGIQTAPALARLAAALARGEDVPPALAEQGVTAAGVSPARFGA
jgi:D-arginine dehydrogenase